MVGVVVGNFKGKQGDLQGDGEAHVFGEKKFAGPGRDSRHGVDSALQTLLSSPITQPAHILHQYLWR